MMLLCIKVKLSPFVGASERQFVVMGFGSRRENPKLLLSLWVNTEGWIDLDFIQGLVVEPKYLIVSPYKKYVTIRCDNRTSSRNRSHLKFLVDNDVFHEVHTDAQTIDEVCDVDDYILCLGQNCHFYVSVSVPLGDLNKNYVYILMCSMMIFFSINMSFEDLPSNVSSIIYYGPHNPYQVPMWPRLGFP
jgi:hypothetical protein